MFISSRVSSESTRRFLGTILSHPDPEISKLAYFPSPMSDDTLDSQRNDQLLSRFAANGDAILPADEQRQESGVSNASTVTERPRQGSFRYRHVYERQSTYKIEKIENKDFGRTESHEAQARWALVATAIARYPAIASRFRPPRTDVLHPDGPWLQSEIEDLLVDSASNWPTNELMRSVPSLVMGMVLWFVSTAYGAIHLAAWNDYFPTVAEKWLWRGSAIWMSASGLVWVCINLVAQASSRIDHFWISFLRHQTPWWSYPVVYGLCSICGVAYVFARAFLVVEAFISVRELPVEAYDTTRWAQLVPHL